MNRINLKSKSPVSLGILILLAGLMFNLSIRAQTIYVVDSFDPSGVGGNSYASGQIGNIWGNWFGTGFSNLVWDSTSDASNNPTSGSMRITANFSSVNNQFEVYDGFNGITPALNGLLYTNFQCDVRFAQGSAVVNNTFGHLQFGIAVGYNQDYFGSVDVSSSNTNWVHVNINLDAATDSNLQNIGDLLIHMYGPTMSGVSTFWMDNIKFTGGSPAATNCIVDWNDVHQRIDGFGASSAWNGSWTTPEADILFSTNTGIIYTDKLGSTSTNNGVGLSLLRTRIAPGGTTVENNIMQLAQARGAKVWSTPWSPATQFKSNGNVNGGSFVGNAGNYQAYANQLASYVLNMKNQYNVSLYAISVQNEPDANVTTYESCNWTAQQIHDFVPYLYNALAADGVGSTKIMLPESENWQDPSNLTVMAMTDPNVAADVGIVADHNYDGANGPATLTKNNYGKALWETEVSLLSGSDGSIANGIYYAQRIYLFMTQAQVNAWHYWWLVAGNSSGNQGLLDNNATPTKRLFTVGNYSRFVRPGYYRIGVVNNNPLTSISAYKDPVSGSFAIVVVNPLTTSVTQIFNLANFNAGSVTPWITSSNLSLANQSPVTVAGSSFSYTLPAMSVVTLIGQEIPSNTPPTLAPISDQTINAGMTLVVTNVATDADLPSQTLTFNLLNAPGNATLDSSSGIFTWRPFVSQANTTNLISVEVTDNGVPSLSATNNFNVLVNPLVQPTFSSIDTSGGRVNLTVNGPIGPDYTVLTSTNLTDWQVLFTTNSPVTPITLTDPDAGVDSARFYRIQLGP